MLKTETMLRKKAPAFTLHDQDDEPVSLKDFAGKWVVLYFYPKDDTPGCTTEACEFTSGIRGFEDLNAVVLGVSKDSPSSHRAFIDKHQLRVRLLSDPDHKVMEKYGAWGVKHIFGQQAKGTIRSTVLIDPKGYIVKHWAEVTAEGHAEHVRQALAELQE